MQICRKFNTVNYISNIEINAEFNENQTDADKKYLVLESLLTYFTVLSAALSQGNPDTLIHKF